jgi:hypothetical protein
MGDTALHCSFDARYMGAITGTVTRPPAPDPGAVTSIWTLPAALYPDYYALATAIETAIQTITGDGSWAVSLPDSGGSGGGTGEYGIRLAHGGDAFDATFPYCIQLHTGWSASYANKVVATGSAVIGWWPSLPIGGADVWYRWAERVWDEGDDGSLDPVVAAGLVEPHFAGTLQYESGDVADLRVLLAEALRGRQVRCYLDTDNGVLWAETNRTGYLDLRLVDEAAVEAWLDEPAATRGSFTPDLLWVDYA